MVIYIHTSNINNLDFGGQAWIILPKPRGERCLVYTNWKKTISRNKNGYIIEVFQSNLPNG